MILEISAIIATKDRPEFLLRTLLELSRQSHLPFEVIVVDASGNGATQQICQEQQERLGFKIVYSRAVRQGAAAQRLQGMEFALKPIIWFLDDDILLEDNCTILLWGGFESNDRVGAVNAMITNQHYTDPGRMTSWMYRIMHGSKLSSYAGKVIGPAWNLLPEDKPDMPEYVKCEWLNTTCTMYRREAMPQPVFSDFFQGYSLMEDVALSVTMGQHYSLINARTARIFHDSQPGSHKRNALALSRMEIVNRHYIMTKVLKRNSIKNYLKLCIFELFGIASNLRSWRAFGELPRIIAGKCVGILVIAGATKSEN